KGSSGKMPPPPDLGLSFNNRASFSLTPLIRSFSLTGRSASAALPTPDLSFTPENQTGAVANLVLRSSLWGGLPCPFPLPAPVEQASEHPTRQPGKLSRVQSAKLC